MQKSMQTPLPFSLQLLLHGQLKYLPLQLNQQVQQCLDCGGGRLGQVHVGECGTVVVVSLLGWSDGAVGMFGYLPIGVRSRTVG